MKPSGSRSARELDVVVLYIRRALLRTLHQYLAVATELIVYPGESHGVATYEHRKAKVEWDLAGFDRYRRNSGESASEEPSATRKPKTKG